MSMSGQIELPQQRRCGGRVRGAEGYHKEDVVALLECVRRVLPTKPQDWDQVLEEYRKTHAGPKGRSLRDAHSLKIKFKQLARSKEAHPEAQEASAIYNLMSTKTTDGKPPQRRGGRVRGAEGFSTADSEAILSAVRHILPVRRTDWEQVADEYCREYAGPNERLSRDSVSLRHKFRTWLRDDVPEASRPLAAEALVIQASIDDRAVQLGREVSEQLEEPRSPAEVATRADDERDGGEAEGLKTEPQNGQEKSTTSSEGGGKPPAAAPRRGGRTLGSEGYTRTDTRALLTCVKHVLPVGPASWEQVLQLYRVNHCVPKERSQRSLTGVKIKFRQLVNWKHDKGKAPPEEVLEARSIQREIDLRERLGTHPRSENGSTGSFSKTPEATGSSLDYHDEQHDGQPVSLVHGESRTNENLERQNVAADAAVWAMSSHPPVAEPAAKRQRLLAPKGPEGEAVRSEIASKELELLRHREQRETEQAVWEKERSLREKQRMDMEAWTFVCDRLRVLYREQSTETNPDILSEIKDEIVVLKKKKQRLAGSMM
ncbi:hypothetical protein PF005_g5054 [Phytophthora fragariae]|uniref:Uncharacterized protein n=2 Tax=Phytophthora fragariae TaxID=53985 RepID=A0A6A4EFJ2_9STRA|nr:hypothetical protein PF005_g5054 [Phytophthora fragariae]KAE9323155.1 hypothetical protein PF001_g4047 [Phytophthora fragariae]KAE9353513.1 hypothetical protein PF008_g4967 [Phytophthora fragariae]